MREQKAELSKRLMKNKDYTVRTMAINMYISSEDVIPDEVVQAGLKDRSICVNAATIYACRRYHIAISPTVIDRFITRNSPSLREAMRMSKNHPSQLSSAIIKSNLTHEYISAAVIKDGLDSYDSRLQLVALNACVGRDDIPLEWIEKRCNDNNHTVRAEAINACANRDNVPLEWIQKSLSEDYWSVRAAAMNACVGRDDIPLEWIQKGLEDKDWIVRMAAMKTCVGRDDIPLEWIEKRLGDDSWGVREAALSVCAGRNDISLEWIEDGLNDTNAIVRLAATNACIGRDDIPLEWIEKMFNDSRRSVQLAAMQYLKAKNFPIPFKRTFEPPDVVYKKCINGVIVCAEIPADAQVRGAEGHKCRTDKAKIIDIIGDFYGEQVGVSTYDCSTLYFVGDEIEIEDFDCGDVECSTGFHFFCTKEEAENY